jgi:parallel beta-helix repeat protein
MSEFAARIIRRCLDSWFRRPSRDFGAWRRGSLIEALETRQLLATFTVTSALDAGEGTLRQAILDANAAPGLDVIEFSIGEGLATIRPAAALPDITQSILLDARSQPGYFDVPLIELDGSDAGPDASGLTLLGGANVIQGLIINRFGQDGLVIRDYGSPNFIQGNYIGTDATGAQAQPNGRHGVFITQAANNNIGSNLISGNTGDGIHLNASSDTFIYDNRIGTDIGGVLALGNANGVAIVDSANIYVAGIDRETLYIDPAARNLISGNRLDGIDITGAASIGNIIYANNIGADDYDNPVLGNRHGIAIRNSASFSSIRQNFIGGNSQSGILILDNAAQNRIQDNSIFANLIGIDLGGDGVTANDADDADAGPNALQNYPILSRVYLIDGQIHVQGSLHSTPNTGFEIQLFLTPAPTTQEELAQGQTPLSVSLNGTTDQNGFSSFATEFPWPDAIGDVFTATATDSDGNTSEFSPAIALSDAPASLIANGSLYLNGFTGVEFNGVLATLIDPDVLSTAQDFTVTIDWSDQSPFDTATVIDAGDGLFQILGSHTYADPGIYPVAIQITHTDSRTAETAAVITISPPDLQLSPYDLSLDVSDDFPIPLATLFDPLDADLETFSVTINWGDNSEPSAGSILNGEGGYEITGFHTYAESGIYDVLITVHQDQRSAVAHATATVREAGLLLGRTELQTNLGTPFNDQVLAQIDASADPAEPGELSALIDWGDDTTSPATIQDLGENLFQVLGSHQYDTPGDFTARITITRSNERTASISSTIHVLSPELWPLEMLGQQIATFTRMPAEPQRLARFTDPKPDTTAADYSATILWENGKTTRGLVVAEADGSFSILGKLVFKQPGQYQAQIHLAHSDGRETQALADISVIETPLRGKGVNVIAIEGLTMPSLRIATFVANDQDAIPSPQEFDAAIDWGDGQQSAGAIVLQRNGKLTVVGAHTYALAGEYRVYATIHHASGAAITTRSNARVINAPLISHTQPLRVTAHKPTQGTLFAFIDSNPLARAQDYQGTIRWGDKTQSPAAIRLDRRGRFLVMGKHTYKKTGSTTILLDLLDSAGSHNLFRIPVLIQ